MPQSGDVPQPVPQPSADDSFLDLLVETLASLDESARGQFLRQYFRTIAQVDLPESQSLEHWETILARHRELSEGLRKKISLKAVIIEVLASSNIFRVPVIMEYDELKKLQVNAATDPLTGLHNRRFFDEACEKELNRAKRYGHSLTFVLMDLHKLKEVNDQRGHLEGDAILQLAAKMLTKTLRASDTAFRIGGDEFALLLPQTDSEQATTLCRRVRAQYEAELRPMRLGVGVTLDFGVAVFPQDGDQQRALLALADERLYALKQAGRSTPSRVIPLETHTREAGPSSLPAATPKPTPVPSQGPAPVGQQGPASVPNYPVDRAVEFANERQAERVPARASEQRKWERVSLAGTKAHAVLTELGQKNARVIDLSYGGVSLLLSESDDLPEQFNAVLNVPILPPVRVVLKRAYAFRTEGGRTRVGCSFVS